MLLLHLVKKDFLLIKNNLLLMMLLAVAVPLFVMWRVPELAGYIAFIFSVVFTELMICQSVAVEEAKFPKTAALICATSYPRSIFVTAKYAVFLLLFVYCYVIYGLLALFMPNVNMINLSMVLFILFLGVTLYGAFLPAYFKYGFEKTKIFFIAAIFLISFGTPLFYNYFSGVTIDFSFIESIPTVVLNLLLLLLTVVALSISMAASIRIYSKKEL